VATARASLSQYEAKLQPAIAQLRQAIRWWQEVGSVAHLARLRLRLARLHCTEGDPEAAELELSCAKPCLERLGSAALLAEAEDISQLIRAI
jgi:hypothetical protein